jgi:diguanylate cyclase (GGDEF)-like protein
MRWLRAWWSQPDHYDWIVAYLISRGLAGLVRALVGGVTVLSGTVLIALMATPAGAHGVIPTLAVSAATGGLISLGLLWIVVVPSKRQSTVFAAGTTTCIAVAAVSCRDPLMAMLISAAFATAAGYIAFAHTAGYAVYNFQSAVAVAILEAARMATSGRLIEGACAAWIVVVLTLSVPAGIQIIVHSLGIDLLEADTDPLTLVLNRRAFIVKAREMISRGRGTDAYLTLMVLDLDDFKVLNDTSGHSVGDRALVAVAEILRAQTRGTAVIGRSGGDEFLIVDTTSTPDQTPAAERLRIAIAELPDAITASIGIATTALIGVVDSTIESVINDLVIAADLHMYAAKRAGGNRIQSGHAEDLTGDSGWPARYDI